MKEILFFGDSNTFGFNPMNGLRFDSDTRWTSIAKKILENKYKICEAGCNNRTLYSENPAGELFIGIKIIKNYIRENTAIAVIQLGINDTQSQYKFDEQEFENSLNKFIDIIEQKSNACKIILISPEPIKQSVLKTNFGEIFGTDSIEKSKIIPKIIERVVRKRNLGLFEIEKFAKTSEIDGLHYDSNNHKIIGEKIAEKIFKEEEN